MLQARVARRWLLIGSWDERPRAVGGGLSDKRMTLGHPSADCGGVAGGSGCNPMTPKDIHVAGVGMTQFGKQLDRSLRSLAESAVGDALADAGATPEAVEYAFFSNAVAGL